MQAQVQLLGAPQLVTWKGGDPFASLSSFGPGAHYDSHAGRIGAGASPD